MSDKAPLPEQETNTPKEKSLAEKFLEDKRNAAMGNSGNKNPGSNKPWFGWKSGGGSQTRIRKNANRSR